MNVKRYPMMRRWKIREAIEQKILTIYFNILYLVDNI